MSTIKRTFDTMTAEELISELQAREVRIQSLERECKKWKASAKAITAKTPAPAAAVSPEKAKESARNLKNLITRGIKSQIKWKPSLKHGSGARFSWASLCDEATARAFLAIPPTQKVKGKKFKSEDFEDLVGSRLTKSIRYGYLTIRGNVNVSYTQAGEIKVTGGYGLPE